jgi:hypothetical protein
MACRFRREGIIEPDIFGSWVIWMWELCNSETFKELWAGSEYEQKIEFNYIAEFRQLINAGIHYAFANIKDLVPGHDTTGDFTYADRMRSFARYTAHHFINPVTEGEPDRYVARWLGPKSLPTVTTETDRRDEYAVFSKVEWQESGFSLRKNSSAEGVSS